MPCLVRIGGGRGSTTRESNIPARRGSTGVVVAFVPVNQIGGVREPHLVRLVRACAEPNTSNTCTLISPEQ